MVILSLILAFLAQGVFKADLSVPSGVILYIIAIVLFILSFRKDPDQHLLFDNKHRKVIVEVALVTFLVLIAIFFRGYRLDTQPGLWVDEAYLAINAIEIIEGKEAPIWGVSPFIKSEPQADKISNLYLYYIITLFKVSGINYIALKMASILPAIFTVIISYFLFRGLTNPSVAFLGGFLLAVSQWNVTISRWGWIAVMMVFLQVLSYYLLIKGLDSDRRRYFILGGIAIGLSLYTYAASPIGFLIPLVFLLLKSLFEKGFLKKQFKRALLFFVTALMIFFPLALYYIQYPDDLLLRAKQQNLFQEIGMGEGITRLIENMKIYTLMFNYKGDLNGRHNIPGEPALDFLTSIFFVLGLTYTIWHLRRSYYLLSVVWLGIGLLGGVLSAAAPHAVRTLIVSPVACLLAGMAIYVTGKCLLANLSNSKAKNLIAFFLSFMLLGYIAIENYNIYFKKRPAMQAVWQKENLDLGIPRMINSLLKDNQKDNQLVVVDPSLLWVPLNDVISAFLTNSYFLNYQPNKGQEGGLFKLPYKFDNIFSGNKWKLDERAKVAYISPPEYLPFVNTYFPNASIEKRTNPLGEDIYIVVRIFGRDLNVLADYKDRKLMYLHGNLGFIYIQRTIQVESFKETNRILYRAAAEEFRKAGLYEEAHMAYKKLSEIK